MSKLLLVEDNQMISTMIKLRLMMQTHDVDCAFNGQEGYDHAMANHYDAILLDMHMPVMDGHEAARKLRENNYTGLIIAVTASVMAEDTDSAIKSGCNHFIAKPIDKDFETTVAGFITAFEGR